MQKSRILNHLERYKTLTSMQAFEQYGITRLASQINKLRNKGYDIATIMMEGENRYGEPVRYAKYVLRGEPET